MPDDIQVDEKLLEAFHLMYGNFPEAAQLTHKSRRIVALNPASEKIGRRVGMVCAKHGPPESHQGCLAVRAVKEHTPKWSIKEDPHGKHFAVLWLPVPGYPDFYIHFSAGKLAYYVNE